MVRIALVGSGHAARTQLQAYTRIENAEVVAVAGRNLQRARTLASEFGIARAYDTLERLLDDGGFEAVDVSSPTESHASIVIPAARHGYHVLCQKPFAPSMEEARDMVDTCRSEGVRLMVNENWRWRAWYRAARSILLSGQLGHVRYFTLQQRRAVVLPTPSGEPSPFLSRQPLIANSPRLVLLEIGVHLVDVARFLFGELELQHAIVQKVTGYVRGEEMASLIVSSRDGFGHIDINWAAYGHSEKPNEDRLLIDGEKGSLALEHTGSIRTAGGGWEETVSLDTEDSYMQSWVSTQRHFVDCLIDGSPFETSGEDNLKTLALVLDGYDRAVYRDISVH